MITLLAAAMSIAFDALGATIRQAIHCLWQDAQNISTASSSG